VDSTVHDTLVRALTPVVTPFGLDLEDVSVAQAGRRAVVRVTVDGDGGVSLDEVAQVSRAISDALDALDGAADPLGGVAYTLEVSTPGVSRPLTTPTHWRRAVGRLVEVEIDNEKLTARIVEVGPDGVVLDEQLPKGRRKRMEASFAELGKGRVQVEFGKYEALDGPDAEDLDVPGDDTDSDEFDDAPDADAADQARSATPEA
jgi:ribosome maturation factor RimP